METETNLQQWAVLYRDQSAPAASPPECFMAWAAGADHAEEQCRNSCPLCEVLWTFQGEADDAYTDYWNA